MIIHKAYKYRLYPTPEQEQFFAHHFGCTRFVYNYLLNVFQQTGKYSQARYKALLPQLKKQFDWLKFPNSQSLQSTVDDLGNAIWRWRKKLGKAPTFKRKHAKNSFEVPQYWHFDPDGKLHIPKLDSGIKIVLHRPIGEHNKKHLDQKKVKVKVNYITISKSPSGKYYAAFSCELEVPDVCIDPTQDAVGIDSGLKDLVVGVNQHCEVKYQVAAPRFFRLAEARISKLQQVLSSKVKGSNNWRKVKKKIAIAYEKVAFKRQDLAHKISYTATQENQLVALETLNVRGMLANGNLAKSVSDAAIRMLHTFTTYKGSWYGTLTPFIDRWFPSTKLCPSCFTINDWITLSDRQWQCQSCGTVHIRDVAAAWNILQEGLRLVNETVLPGNQDLSP